MEIWNNIGPELRQSASLSIFKSNALKLVRFQKKSIFNIHDPFSIRRLFQLRVGLSPLRYHKRGFKDTPTVLCSCNSSAETTEHFLLRCPLYTEARNDLFQVIDPIVRTHDLQLANDALHQFLLYGSENLPNDVNKTVLSATMIYIKHSKRFEPVDD